MTRNERSGAIAAFEKCNASKYRFFNLRSYLGQAVEMNDASLGSYLETSRDKSFLKWAGQNAEGHNEFATAAYYYGLINDICSLVRVHCHSGNIQKAAELADLNENDFAAQYLLASEYEQSERYTEAIVYFTKAKSISSAIRVAKEQNITQELMQLSLKGTKSDLIDVAKYFEERIEDFEKAALLYSKAGLLFKAVHMCFRTSNIEMLHDIGTKI